MHLAQLLPIPYTYSATKQTTSHYCDMCLDTFCTFFPPPHAQTQAYERRRFVLFFYNLPRAFSFPRSPSLHFHAFGASDKRIRVCMMTHALLVLLILPQTTTHTGHCDMKNTNCCLYNHFCYSPFCNSRHARELRLEENTLIFSTFSRQLRHRKMKEWKDDVFLDFRP